MVGELVFSELKYKHTLVEIIMCALSGVCFQSDVLAQDGFSVCNKRTQFGPLTASSRHFLAKAKSGVGQHVQHQS